MLWFVPWEAGNVKAQEHLDRLFISSLVHSLSCSSDISVTSKKVHMDIAESLSALEEGWWLQSGKDSTGTSHAWKVAKKIHSHYCTDHKPWFCIRGSTNHSILPPSLGRAHKSALMVISCQALHHIEFYSRQKCP